MKKNLILISVTFERFLLDVNKNLINKKDNLNRTALHYAYGIGDRKMIEYLAKSGIETKVRLTIQSTLLIQYFPFKGSRFEVVISRRIL